MRLIDADALEDKIGSNDHDIEFKELIHDTPTIVAYQSKCWKCITIENNECIIKHECKHYNKHCFDEEIKRRQKL